MSLQYDYDSSGINREMVPNLGYQKRSLPVSTGHLASISGHRLILQAMKKISGRGWRIGLQVLNIALPFGKKPEKNSSLAQLVRASDC